ncbi:MAG TPA: hypothetical protein PK264_20160, partial [Hyphomicrobiaceae bacterium]|nr:hypothetical protein [Hyphomicrobiaceae bacterium]
YALTELGRSLSDAVRKLDLLDQNSMQLPLRMRPGSHAAAILWSQQFTGDAVGLDKLLAAQLLEGVPGGTGIPARAVKTGR